MKSIVTICHGPSGILFGVRGTYIGYVIFFVFWHIAHPVMYSFTNIDIPGYQKLSDTRMYVFHCPGCPVAIESWYILTILLLSSSSGGTYIFPWCQMSSSSKFHFYSPFANALSLDALMISIASITSLSLAITSFNFCLSCLSSSPIVPHPIVLLTNNCGFNSVWFVLFVFIPRFRSGCQDRALG